MRFSSLVDLALRNGARFGIAGLLVLMSIAIAESGAPLADRNFALPGKTLRCSLPVGATSFVFRMKDLAERRSVTLVNKNGAAAGELWVAVSNLPLAVDNPGWRTVEGAIRFREKRSFTLSLVGVEAKYVKVTFRVEAPSGKMTAGS